MLFLAGVYLHDSPRVGFLIHSIQPLQKQFPAITNHVLMQGYNYHSFYLIFVGFAHDCMGCRMTKKSKKTAESQDESNGACPSNLDSMKRRDLQKLCKSLNLRAVGKVWNKESLCVLLKLLFYVIMRWNTRHKDKEIFHI